MVKPIVEFKTPEDFNMFNMLIVAQKALEAEGAFEKAAEVTGRVVQARGYDEAINVIKEYVDFK